jgi:mannose-6-phosphate isomerase-like protein (cupin superfamily)
MARQEVNSLITVTRALSVHLGTPRMTGREQDLRRAAGSARVGLRREVITPGKQSGPRHAHMSQEEISVVLQGRATLLRGEERVAVEEWEVIRLGRPKLHQSNHSGSEARGQDSSRHRPQARDRCIAFTPLVIDSFRRNSLLRGGGKKPAGGRGRQEIRPRFATRGPVDLDSMRVGAVLKACAISVGSLPWRLLFGYEGV